MDLYSAFRSEDTEALDAAQDKLLTESLQNFPVKHTLRHVCFDLHDL